MNLQDFDYIVLNTSGGKDSQAMMDLVVKLACEAGVLDRVLAVHADLGRMEWPGTKELVAEQCATYRIPLRIVKREKGDLLEQVEARGMWPDSSNRYCTSDHKRDQIAKVYTTLSADQPRRIRILNCLGFRAEESPARSGSGSVAITSRPMKRTAGATARPVKPLSSAAIVCGSQEHGTEAVPDYGGAESVHGIVSDADPGL